MEKNQQCSLWNGGVGLMVSKTAASTLAEVKEWNGRFLVANFSGSPALTITVRYSPIEGNVEAEDHYDHPTAVSEIPKHNMLIVTGDFIAHLGQSVIEYSYHNTCNSNGRLVKNVFEETNLSLQMEVSRRWLGSSGHYFGYEWYENTGRLHHGQQKMKELCTRLSIKANEETAKKVLPKRKKGS